MTDDTGASDDAEPHRDTDAPDDVDASTGADESADPDAPDDLRSRGPAAREPEWPVTGTEESFSTPYFTALTT